VLEQRRLLIELALDFAAQHFQQEHVAVVVVHHRLNFRDFFRDRGVYIHQNILVLIINEEALVLERALIEISLNFFIEILVFERLIYITHKERRVKRFH